MLESQSEAFIEIDGKKDFEDYALPQMIDLRCLEYGWIDVVHALTVQVLEDV